MGIGQKNPKRKSQAQLRGEYTEWTTQPDRCAMCWIPSGRCAQFRFNPALEMAHIFSRGKAGKKADCIENVILLCSTCHGAHYSTAYVYNDILWPNIDTCLLLKVKLELNEMNLDQLTIVSGFQPRFIKHLTQVAFPKQITSERMRWK